MNLSYFILLYISIKKIFSCKNYIKFYSNYIDIDYISKFFIINIIKNDLFIHKFKNLLIKKYPICVSDLNFNIYINKEFEKYDNEIIDITPIYPYDVLKNNTIKIIHKGNENINNKSLCIFGILENKNGFEIEKEMIEWLLLDYDVYCVYQKFPGLFYEYPAIRFAQWLLIKKNYKLCLYIHTKGAFNFNSFSEKVRNVWKTEYTGIRKKKYIYPIINNFTDVTCILSGKKKETWFNGFFISQKGFEILGLIKTSKNRYLYERLFINNTVARVWGIIRNNIKDKTAIKTILKYTPEKYSDKIKIYI